MRAEARFLHHEAPAPFSDRTGDHCRGPTRAANSVESQIFFVRLLAACFQPCTIGPLCLTHAHSLSLLLHVCLPAASLSMQHVLTVQWHSMLPCRPPGVSEELWALELPSILGVAHSDFTDSPEPSSPSALPAHPGARPRAPCVTPVGRLSGRTSRHFTSARAWHELLRAPLHFSRCFIA